MSQWPGSKARRVYKALLSIGWVPHHILRGSSHQQLFRDGYPDFNWAFHDSEEVGPGCWPASPKRPA